MEPSAKVLVLTERTAHANAIAKALGELVPAPFVLHGRMSKKQRATVMEQLSKLPGQAPRVLVATGKLVGEGFDHPALDTMVLAMPISWRGTLQQYAGRLHRGHATKTDVRTIDFVDAGHPAQETQGFTVTSLEVCGRPRNSFDVRHLFALGARKYLIFR
jgi:superfamily II DNA or RNA helicase